MDGHLNGAIADGKAAPNRARGTRIDSLQALRALAFLGIFFFHAGFSISWSALGVSEFFVLSGFLMIYGNKIQEDHPSLKGNFVFAASKIKKLYFLHIITMLCAVILSVCENMWNYGVTRRFLTELFAQICLNVALIQTWVPNSNVNVSLNGVAWFLSAMTFLYFIYPYMSQFIRRQKLTTLFWICVCIIAGQVIVCVPFIVHYGGSHPVYIWFMYCFPVFRLGDFFVGGCLGKAFTRRLNKTSGIIKSTIYEIAAILVTVGVFIWRGKEHQNVVSVALCNWTTLYIPIAAIWVYLFGKKEGIITGLLTNKLTVYIGNLSSYLFLIHYVVTQTTGALLTHFGVQLDGIEKTWMVFAELAVSVFFSVLYQKISRSGWRSWGKSLKCGC